MWSSYYVLKYIGHLCLQTPITGFHNVKGVILQKVTIRSLKTQQGSLTAHQPLELLCIDFTKADVAKGGKENILVLTDAFSKFSQAFVTSSQKSLVMLPNC